MHNELAFASVATLSMSSSAFSGFARPAPASVRSRRSHGSSLDQNPTPGQYGIIEEDLRAGGPALCQEPCITVREIPSSHQYHNALRGPDGYELRTRLGDICREARLPVLDMLFCGRRSEFGSNRRLTLTLLITSNRGADVTKRGWAEGISSPSDASASDERIPRSDAPRRSFLG
jgi:hypothetical protein